MNNSLLKVSPCTCLAQLELVGNIYFMY